MLLPEICIKRPVFATVLSLMLVVLGIIFFTKLQIRGMPQIDPPVITVTTRYAGADALYMEKEITTRIEKALKTVKYIDFTSSTSAAGISNIVLVFKLSADLEIALNDIRSKISEISSIFPEDMSPPAVAKIDSDNSPTFWVSVNSDSYTDLELTRIADERIKSVLEKLPSVGKVNIFGSRYYSMLIEPINSKMHQHNISPIDIESALRKQNRDYPAGIIKTDVETFTVRLDASLNKPEDFEKIILKTVGNTIIRLGDVANVKLGPEDDSIILRYNGSKSIAVGLVKQSNSNVLELSKEATALLQKIKSTLPQGINVDIAFDGARDIKESIKAIFITIFEALLLVVFVTYVFLGSFRITIIPFVTIPVSLISTFSVMYALGFSVNAFTLLAMILSIGLVVDDAIVMMENIFRHHEQGETRIEAALSGSKEISFAVIAMTLTLATVFLPLGFIEGFVGKLFIEFAWTLAFCVLFSGFVALTLTPMMCSLMIAKGDLEQTSGILKKFNYYTGLLQTKYLYYLNIIFDRKKIFFGAIIGSIVILIASFIFVGKSFIPDEDSSFLRVIFSGPEGSSLKRSEKTVMEAEQVLASHKDVRGYFDIIGFGGDENAFAFVPLKDWSNRNKSQEQIRQELNFKFSRIPGMSIFAISPRAIGGGNFNEKLITFTIQSSDEYGKLDALSSRFMEEMGKARSFASIERDFKSSTPTFDLIINRDKAYLYGTSIDTIGTTIQYLIAGRQVGDFRMGNDIYNVILRYNPEIRNNIGALNKILIKTNNSTSLPLGVVASIDEKITVKSYNHYNNSKSVTISADLNNGYKITDAISQIESISKRLMDKNTTSLEYLGEIKRMNEANSNILITFMFAIIFIYLVLSAQFESFKDPLLILVAVPFSITGGVLTLLLFGNTLNLYSNIGLVTLIGLVTKNSIMIVEFANQLREKGMNVHDAIVKAAELRIRPILMTSLSTIFGAIPLALAIGSGAESRKSIGLVIVGGMLVGTVFTVFVIPVLYRMFKKDHAASVI